MRVVPSGGPTPPPPPTPSTGPRPAARATDPAEAEEFAPTGELARLLEAVRQAPDVRADVVADVAARLAAGELDTPAAAADAARGLLRDG
ncbi:MAG: hypothetical protein C0501_16485 [Isosphaera sp.]|nr:hypothetical protein [Isosphaera sp.]